MILAPPTSLDDFGLRFSIEKIDPSSGKLTLKTAEHKDNQRDFIVMQAIVFPQINILWIGCIIMVLGTLLAVRHRIKVNRKELKKG
jgi:cytochrome c-type biogenesis protein CcmF